MVKPAWVDAIRHQSLDFDGPLSDIIKTGAHGTVGAGSGIVVDDLKSAAAIENNTPFILYKKSTAQEDVFYIENEFCQGVITQEGSISSHATVIASRSNKPAVVGTRELDIDVGEAISIDGSLGQVVRGAYDTTEAIPNYPGLKTITEWALEAYIENTPIQKMDVQINSCKASEIEEAIEWGATGVGVAQTEYMCTNPERLPYMQQMLVDTVENETYIEAYKQFLKHETLLTGDQFDYLIKLQNDTASTSDVIETLIDIYKTDFTEMFQAVGDKDITIRLLDAPLNEFKPSKAQSKLLAKKLNKTEAEIEQWAETFNEENPMMGFRGVRLGLAEPEIYRAQTKAIFQAMLIMSGQNCPNVKIMMPMVATEKEMALADAMVENEAAIMGVYKPDVKLMYEIPLAWLHADKMADYSNGGSFGTNDFTQLILGISREEPPEDLAGAFGTLHPGVIEAMRQTIKSVRNIKPNYPFSLCGEQAGDEASIEAAQALKINVISGSGQKIPKMILMATQKYLDACEHYQREHSLEFDNVNNAA